MGVAPKLGGVVKNNCPGISCGKVGNYAYGCMGDGRGAVFCPALCYSRYIDQAVFEIHGVSHSLRVHEIAKTVTNDC